ncbi:MAG: hypothetical protein J6Y80_02080, partial [Victivallales bacterium]|nr:hypothetical protein [Victivallales bacterium]
MNDASVQFQAPSRIVVSGEWLRTRKRPDLAAFLAEHKPQAGDRLEAEELGAWDSTLPIALLELLHAYRQAGLSLDYSMLPAGLAKLLELALASRRPPSATQTPEELTLLHHAGYFGLRVSAALYRIANFVGELALGLG